MKAVLRGGGEAIGSMIVLTGGVAPAYGVAGSTFASTGVVTAGIKFLFR